MGSGGANIENSTLIKAAGAACAFLARAVPPRSTIDAADGSGATSGQVATYNARPTRLTPLAAAD